MTLDNAFKELNTLGLTHEQHQALITLVGKFGRDEYTRGYATAVTAYSSLINTLYQGFGSNTFGRPRMSCTRQH